MKVFPERSVAPDSRQKGKAFRFQQEVRIEMKALAILEEPVFLEMPVFLEAPVFLELPPARLLG